MEFKKMDEIQKRILMEVADLHTVPEGAFNIRSDGQLAGRANSANIEITARTLPTLRSLPRKTARASTSASRTARRTKACTSPSS